MPQAGRHRPERRLLARLGRTGRGRAARSRFWPRWMTRWSPRAIVHRGRLPRLFRPGRVGGNRLSRRSVSRSPTGYARRRSKHDARGDRGGRADAGRSIHPYARVRLRRLSAAAGAARARDAALAAGPGIRGGARPVADRIPGCIASRWRNSTNVPRTQPAAAHRQWRACRTRFGRRSTRRGFALMLARICPGKASTSRLEAAHAAGGPVADRRRRVSLSRHSAYFAGSVRPRLDRWRRFLGPLGFARKRRLLTAARCLLVPSLTPETSSLVAMEARPRNPGDRVPHRRARRDR